MRCMAHPDLDQLLNVALEFAKKILKQNGEFYPFGASMDADGKITMDGATTGEERPPSQELLDLLAQSYANRANSGELRAAAVCADVRVPPPGSEAKTDAIQVGLEHSTGEAVTVFLPYEKGWFGRVRYGNLFASTRDRQFFSSAGGD
jgi:hypothetical protein